MRLLNLLIAGVTFLAVVGGYLQEKARLARIQQMPVAEARAIYDRAERRRERVMIAFTVVLAVGAAAALAFGRRW